MPATTANGISIEYEDHGPRDAPVILLVMGLGGQLTLWPDEFVDALVERGFRVVRYDNRDVGLSTKFDAAGVPNIRWLLLRSLIGLRLHVPYRLPDMAKDGIGLMDALGIDAAHIVGASMGGMIAQHIAATYPARTHSLTSIMSTTGNRRLPRAQPEAMRVLLQRPAGDDAEARVAHAIRAAGVIGSPAYPADPALLEARVRASHARSYHPPGFVRQMAAIVADGDRRAMLARIAAPTLVVHGDADPLVPLEGGRDTAASVPGARLHIVRGMGHDLPAELVDELAGVIAAHASAA